MKIMLLNSVQMYNVCDVPELVIVTCNWLRGLANLMTRRSARKEVSYLGGLGLFILIIIIIVIIIIIHCYHKQFLLHMWALGLEINCLRQSLSCITVEASVQDFKIPNSCKSFTTVYLHVSFISCPLMSRCRRCMESLPLYFYMSDPLSVYFLVECQTTNFGDRSSTH